MSTTGIVPSLGLPSAPQGMVSQVSRPQSFFDWSILQRQMALQAQFFQDEINTLNTFVTTLQTQVNVNEATLNALILTVAALQTQVNTIQTDLSEQFNVETDQGTHRVLGTTYQNTTGWPMLVSVSVLFSNINQNIIAQVGPFSSPTQTVALASSGNSTAPASNLTFLVPNNYFYWVRAVSGIGSFLQWVEWTKG